MRKVIILLIISFSFCNCASIRSYELDRNYSDDINDPARVQLEQKLNGLKEILNNDCTESKLVYVVSGKHLTVKIKNRCKNKLDSIVYFTLCQEFSNERCGLLVKEHL